MPPLVLTQQGTRLTKRDERLVVVQGTDVLIEIPALTVDHVQIMGQGIQISNAALTFLARRGIPVVLTNRSGTIVNVVVQGALPRNAELRLAQAQAIIEQSPLAVGLVQALITTKLHNQRLLLDRYGAQWGGSGPQARQTLEQMRAAVGQSHDLDQIRGYEGAGAAAYWGAWRAVFADSWQFGGRTYYPPPDPINALLSFGYTLLLNDLLAATHAVGLDPALGLFHTVQANRPSFALDLQEEFRPSIVDALVIEVLDSGSLSPADFRTTPKRPGAVYASEQAREQLLTAYVQRLAQPVLHPVTGRRETLRQCLVLQVQQVARMLRGEQTHYQPLPWP